MTEAKFTIGHIAHAAGVNVETESSALYQARASTRDVTQGSATADKNRCQGGLQRNPGARGGKIDPRRKQASRASPTARRVAGLGGRVRSTSWCQLSDHRAA